MFRNFIVRLLKSLIARRNCEESIFQLSKKGDFNDFDFITIICDREYEFIMYKAMIIAFREMFNLLKALIKT